MDRYRDRRSPDRGRYSRDAPAVDSYIPSGSRAARPRSRSPDSRFYDSREPPRTDTWRGRARSPLAPPRRHDSRDTYSLNTRDSRVLSPRRDYGPPDPRFDGAPRVSRARSPTPLKRGREYSPNGRGPRSPPPAKRERLASISREYTRARSPPRRGYSPPRDRTYRPRSRSPPRRNERVDPYAVQSWRRRSPSPRAAIEDPGRNSRTASRRSSPRARNRADPYEIEKPRPTPPDTYRRSPPRARSPFRDDYEYRPSGPEYPTNGDSYSHREPSQHAVDYRDRPPPTGPANHRAPPPSGPTPSMGASSATTLSMSAHNRPGSSSVVPAPTYPRGGYGGYRGRGGPPPPREYPPPHRDFGAPPRRDPAAFGGPSGFGRGAPPPRDPYPPRDPHAPRDPYVYERRGPPPRRGGESFAPQPPLFRGSSNSTATTYPRTQRFNVLSDLPKLKDGGEKLPPLHETGKADKLEEEAARLRKAIDDKEIKKRSGLREWNKLEREAGTAALKSDLAEEHLRSLNGEAEGVGATF